MKAIRLKNQGAGLALVLEDLEVPRPREGEVLVQVWAAGVTPSELEWYPTTHSRTGEPRVDAVPGHEFSGVIAETGAGVTGVKAGDAIYGMNDWFIDGALAEYCIARPEWIAPKPAKLSHAEAATVPIGALTAWQGLVDRAKVKAGERVLVHGGAGAVGVFAVQLARWQNAHVVATVSARDFEFVQSLGAHQTIDYRTGWFDGLQPVDVVFDTVGGATLDRSWGVLRLGGRMIEVAAGSVDSGEARGKEAMFIVEPRRDQLMELSRMLDAGQIRPVAGEVLPLGEAQAAFSSTGEKRKRGKRIISLHV